MEYRESLWQNRFRKLEFTFEGREAQIVLPEKGNARPYWLLKTEYCDAFPNLEEEMVSRGLHRVFLKNINRWGLAEDLDAKARLAQFLQKEFGLYEKCIPVGMSCGGLHAVKQAARHPEMVSCLYLDAPVINILSCPFGLGSHATQCRTHFGMQQEVLDALGLDMTGLIRYREHPLDVLPQVIAAKIPCLLVYGLADQTVVWQENAALVEEAYRDTGIAFKSVAKPGCDHHPHGMEDPRELADFLMQHLR